MTGSARANPGGDPGCDALRWAGALLDGLAAGGVRTLVLSPGARSTPLVIAAARREAAGRLALVPILDERDAGFFALGLARASARPVALLATSGSAPAHWYPAVIEASACGLPLVLLSADRPPRLRGFGANQTIDQTRLFGAFVIECHDPGLPVGSVAGLKAIRALGLRAATQARGPRPGPVHLNLPFDEPLVPAGDCADLSAGPEAEAHDGRCDQLANAWLHRADTPAAGVARPAGRGLIVAGPDALGAAGPTPSRAAAFWHHAARLGLPVLADPLSGLRTGPLSGGANPGPETGPDAGQRITGYDSLLRHPDAARALRPDWVLRLGRAPVSKTLGQWLAGVPSLLVDPTGGWCDPDHDLIARLPADPLAVMAALAAGAATPDPGRDAAWLAAWGAADARVAALADDWLASAPWGEGQLIRALVDQIAPGEGLLCANSLPIRQLDCWLTGAARVARGIRLFGNRGVSGIDGQVATLAGLNAGGVPTWGLLGDLSLTHNLGGLLLAARLGRPLLVINNGGGRIFDELPQRGQPGFERLWRTPVAPPLGLLAAPFGLTWRRVSDAAGLAAALAEPAPPGTLIEVVIDAAVSADAHRGFRARVAADAGLRGLWG